MGKESAGGISLISVTNAKKAYITGEKQSPFHLSFSLSFSTCSHSTPPFQSLPLCPPLFSFFMLHNGILRNLYPPLYPSSSSIIPFLSSTLSSSSSSSTFFPPGLSLTFHFSLSHYSEGATTL